jgi:hypothetical protein
MLSSFACGFSPHMLLFLPAVFFQIALYFPKMDFSSKSACAQQSNTRVGFEKVMKWLEKP